MPSTTFESGHKYYAGLDTLRAAGILLVICSHWLPYDHLVNSLLQTGPMGVTLFFVLSGFLITGILIEEQAKHELHQRGKLTIFKAFYLKRSLRIFPIYYLTLVLMVLLNKEGVREFFWWHFSYGSNILFYLKKSWMSEFVSPLWSLAVEEQFYIFWPCLILFCNKRMMLVVLIACIVVGTLFRMLPESLHEKPYSFIQVLTPACMDCFAMGGLIAYTLRFYPAKIGLFKKISGLLSIIGAFYLLIVVQFYGNIDFVSVVFNRNIYSCFASFYILFVVTNQGDGHWLARDLENMVLVYIGRISYSMYLWHNLIPYMDNIESFGLRLLARFSLLLLFSTLSYFLIEQPLLKLKKHIK